MIEPDVFRGKQFAGKISGNAGVVGGESVGVEARNTYTCGAEAGEVNEMNK
jgi:hypothetical protein